VILAGENAIFECYSSYSPPYWHFYSLASNVPPCSFDSSSLYPGVSLCPSVLRLSVTTSSSEGNKTILTISSAQLSDAGTYTCGDYNPNNLSTAVSVIVGVIGTWTQTSQVNVKVKRTCIALFVKLQLKALRYGSHRVAPANYTIPASTLRTFARGLGQLSHPSFQGR